MQNRSSLLILGGGMVLLIGLGIAGYLRLRRIVEARIEQELTTILETSVASLHTWVDHHRNAVIAAATDQDVRRSAQLMAADRASPRRAGDSHSAATDLLKQRLSPVVTVWGFEGWMLFDRDGRLLAADPDRAGSVVRTLLNRPELRAVFAQGRGVLSVPFTVSASDSSASRGIDALMFAGAPIADSRDSIVAALTFTIHPGLEFTGVFRAGRMGSSGETYAFNRDGVMVSGSRFDEQLRTIGLLPADTAATAVLHVDLRDPGGNLLFGYPLPANRQALPLTHMAASAINGTSGLDVTGYHDYRGVDVVGAWRWLPEMELGVATEVDKTEAFRGLIAVQNGFWALLSLLAAGLSGLFFYSRATTALRRRVRRAERLGQYHLERKLGAGGMGEVYLGHHAFLRRPTAVKVIKSRDVSEHQVARFEREVRYTSRLSHPNTIAVYDYGRTPNRVFYYAMEYVDGITLDELVSEAGPIPDGRLVYLLRQVCGSLAEAHGQQLIHRDIKPANIMVGVRGGLPDFVKVLDFGLVREIDQSESVAITQAGSLTGTPLYITPEAIQMTELDARSDLYALGAVAYFLVTGTPPFRGHTLVEICAQHIHAQPEPIASRVGRQVVSSELESLIMSCLAKEPVDRPQSAAILSARLQACSITTPWSQEQAGEWWNERKARIGTESAAGDREVDEIEQTEVASLPDVASDHAESIHMDVDISEGRLP